MLLNKKNYNHAIQHAKKNKNCKLYLQYGYCKYGAQCKFTHVELNDICRSNIQTNRNYEIDHEKELSKEQEKCKTIEEQNEMLQGRVEELQELECQSNESYEKGLLEHEEEQSTLRKLLSTSQNTLEKETKNLYN